MNHGVTMPALSDTMGSGRLVKWIKKPGDKIKKGDVIAEVETDKAVMDVEAFDDGYLSGPLIAEGTEAPVGQVIGYIADDLKDVARAEVAATAAAAAVAAPQPGPAPQAAPPPLTAHTEPAPASAVLAASMGSMYPPTARRVHQAPTLASAVTPAPPPEGGIAAAAIRAGPPYKVERTSSLREAVARNMIASAAAPTFRVTAQLPLEPLVQIAKDKNQSLTLLLARACARTVVAHPLFNAAYTPDGLARRERVDIGIAVDSGEGLITPVLRDAAGRSLQELAKDWSGLREKVRSRRLAPADYSGATFYLSDLGVFPAVYAFDSIVPIGASAILSVAAARKPGTFFTLTCDHRVVFGADAARFLETLQVQLKNPEKLLA